MLECVVNVSEGRDEVVLDALRDAAGGSLLDLHADPHHNRSVLTLAGPDVEAAAQAVSATTVGHVDLREHVGAHPRLGAVDVVPFVPLEGASMEQALGARDRFAAWAGSELGVPCFLYGPSLRSGPASQAGRSAAGSRPAVFGGEEERSLPDVRRLAFSSLAPDTGPSDAHPTAGAISVGARPVLIAYNVWLIAGTKAEVAKHVAATVRGPAVRAFAFELGGMFQVSMNLLDWQVVGPANAYDAVVRAADHAGADVFGAELVGLLPELALEAVPKSRWAELGLEGSKTIEARLRVARAR